MIIGASGGSGFLFIIIIAFLLLYLIVVRPQKRRQNEQRQLVSDLRVGDEVLTGARAFTKGYRLFHPHRVIGWHAYDAPPDGWSAGEGGV